MFRLKVTIVQAILFIVACAVLAISQEPLPGRRSVTPEEVQRILANNGDDYMVKLMKAQGYAGNLTKSQLAIFRQRGIGEMDLMMYYDEFGITPEESNAIKRAGFNIEIRPFEIWHWTALSDVVCVGKVIQKKDNPQGPYHTYVDIEPIEYFKNTSEQQDRLLQTRILESGSRYGLKEELVQVDAPSEPNLKVGEKVLIFLTRKAFSLTLLLARAEANGQTSDPRFQSEYGAVQKLRSLLNQPGPYEILSAYKIVGNKAVSKLRTLHTPFKTEVVKLDEAKQQVLKVVASQKPFRK